MLALEHRCRRIEQLIEIAIDLGDATIWRCRRLRGLICSNESGPSIATSIDDLSGHPGAVSVAWDVDIDVADHERVDPFEAGNHWI
ncbi:MAG: hypothetical protein R3D31_16480 [Hyphomicrobiaceae bacterium]